MSVMASASLNEKSGNASWELVDDLWRSNGQLPTDARLAHLDHTVLRKLAVQLNELQVYRNQRVPFLLLPEEILLEIMFIVRDIAPTIVDRSQQPWARVSVHSAIAWTSIIQVCHHLRVVALNAKALWSHLSDLTMLPSHVALGLAHSGNTPLHLHLGGKFVEDERIYALLASHNARRVTDLVLELSGVDTESWDEGDVEMLDRQILDRLRRFKQLTALHIVASPDDPTGIIYGLSLRHSPPQLRTLELKGAAFLWKHSIYRDLITLRLTELPEECSPRIHEIATLFPRLRRLETLQFDRTDILEDDTESLDMPLGPLTWASNMRDVLQPPPTLRLWSATMRVTNNVPFAMLPTPAQGLRYILRSLAPPKDAEFIYDNFMSRHLAEPALRPRALELVVRDGPVSMNAIIRFWRSTDTSKPADVELHRAVDDSTYIDPQRLVNGTNLSYLEILVLDVAQDVCFNWWSFFSGVQKLRVLRVAQDVLGDILYTMQQRRIFAPTTAEGTCTIAKPVKGVLQELEVFVSGAEPTCRLHPVDLSQLIAWLQDKHGTGLVVHLPPVLLFSRVFEAAMFEWSKNDVRRRSFQDLMRSRGLEPGLPHGKYITL